ncbi:MAG: cytochrome c biogenesis protein ResB [Lentisphaerae bacterium]|nr:cytochrome c biogenesis protein ResB [Lentisphaerota bacterium]
MDDREAPKDTKGSPRRGVLSRLAAVIASVPFASTIVGIIALACVVGTLLPQAGDVAKYLQEHPDAQGRMDVLTLLGFTNVYSSWWFLGLLGLLGASLAVCTFRRVLVARRQAGRKLWRVLGSVLTHASLLLVLSGGVVRGIWGEKGHLAFREGDTRSEFVVAGEPRPLPFSVHLVKFEIEHYKPSKESEQAKPRILAERLHVTWPERHLQWSIPVKLNAEQFIVPEGEERGGENTFRVTIRRRVHDFVLDTASNEVKSRSEEPKNPAILIELTDNSVTNTQWLFARHPGFNMHGSEGQSEKLALLRLRYDVQTSANQPPKVKDYRSTLRIIENGETVAEKTIEVNSPLSYGGYTFYQSGFNPKDSKWTSLQVVRDPGVPLVYAGFAFMILGLIAVFYLYPGTRRVIPLIDAQEERPHGNDV